MTSVMPTAFVGRLFAVACALLLAVRSCSAIGQIVWAVNSGGDALTDSAGISYQKDPLSKGIPSDFGKRLLIQRVPKEDHLLYQTERYNDATFGYDIPVTEDGDYVLVLKFCEVWFTAANEKVFDVSVNDHTVISDLDIFGRVGYGTALDEHIPFTIKNGILRVAGEALPYKKVLSVKFVKGKHDNPKINALYVMKGKLDDVPQLLPVPVATAARDDDEEVSEQSMDSGESARPRRHVSGPRVVDPYSTEDSSGILLPLAAAVGAFLPLLYCLCKI